MPYAPPKHCPRPGHPPYTGKRCPLCAKDYDQRRGGARQRGYTSAWERESKAFLALPRNRLCACGCGQRADVVDHKAPHKGDQKLFWDRSNWQPMHHDCHNRKSMGQDRGAWQPGQTRNNVAPEGGGGSEFQAERAGTGGWSCAHSPGKWDFLL
ncbi:5-methylcytosine-specific restriction protein A [Azospirillum soli]|nr:5-methylcytosine-specific restriction protein A [Azospirillum soli]